MPIDNQIPLSYNQIKNTLKRPELKTFHICKICGNELDISIKNGRKIKRCLTDLCASSRSGIKPFNLIKVISSDIIPQIKILWANHMSSIVNYKGKFVIYPKNYIF